MIEFKVPPEPPECVRAWTMKVNDWFNKYGIEKAPKVIIVNQEDCIIYDNYLSEYYKAKTGSPIVPVDSSGLLKFKGIEVGISKDVERNDCILMRMR